MQLNRHARLQIFTLSPNIVYCLLKTLLTERRKFQIGAFRFIFYPLVEPVIELICKVVFPISNLTFSDELSLFFKVTSVVTVVEVTETVIYNQNRIVFHYKKSRG